MARPQTFSEDQALEKAMELFWEKGFKATSMRDLVDYTGVCRASLYKTFGNKEDIYTKALTRYQQLMATTYSRPLGEEENVKNYLREVFLTKVEEIINENPAGCMVLNATTELLRKDKHVKEMLLANETAQRTWLASLLQEGKKRGEFDPAMNITTTAHYLFFAFQGITINAMTQDNKQDLIAAINLLFEKI